jgi:hypothetical protein
MTPQSAPFFSIQLQLSAPALLHLMVLLLSLEKAVCTIASIIDAAQPLRRALL